MGVRGLQTFAAENSRALSEEVQYRIADDQEDMASEGLAVETLVVDAFAIMFALSSKIPFLTGDTTTFVERLTTIIRLWRKAGLEPFFVFDGVFDANADASKLDTQLQRRGQNVASIVAIARASNSLRSSPSFQQSCFVMPPTTKAATVRLLRELNVNFVQCFFDADSTLYQLANERAAYVLSQDSDFLIFGHGPNVKGYVPIDSMSFEVLEQIQEQNLTSEGFHVVQKKKNRLSAGAARLIPLTQAIPCNAQVVSCRFNSFSSQKLAVALQIPHPSLPLLAALTGNDFIPHSDSAALYPHRTTPAQRLTRAARAIWHVQVRSNAPRLTSPLELIDACLVHLLSDLHPSSHISTSKREEMAQRIASAAATYLPTDIYASPMFHQGHDNQQGLWDEYLCAAKAGHVDQGLMSVLFWNVTMHCVHIENVDEQSTTLTIGRQLRQWCWSILHHGGMLKPSEPQSGEKDSEYVVTEYLRIGARYASSLSHVQSLQSQLLASSQSDFSETLLKTPCQRWKAEDRLRLFYHSHNMPLDGLASMDTGHAILTTCLVHFARAMPGALSKNNILSFAYVGCLAHKSLNIPVEKRSLPNMQILTLLSAWQEQLRCSSLVLDSLLLTQVHGDPTRHFNGRALEAMLISDSTCLTSLDGLSPDMRSLITRISDIAIQNCQLRFEPPRKMKSSTSVVKSELATSRYDALQKLSGMH